MKHGRIQKYKREKSRKTKYYDKTKSDKEKRRKVEKKK